MPRKRSLLPETQAQDRAIAKGVVLVLTALAARYPTAGLNSAASLVDDFAESAISYPVHKGVGPAESAVAEWDAAVADTVERQS